MHTFFRLSAALALSTAMMVPVSAEPVTYVVDSNHTFPRISYTHMGLSTQVHRFLNTTGTIVYDADAQTADVNITIDMNSIETGSEAFNGHIKGADFFDTENHPDATFKSTNVIFENGVPSKVEGELTIKGITKPATLTLNNFVAKTHPMLPKEAIGADAWTVITRSDFDAGKHAPANSDEVRIDVSLEAIAQ